MAAEQLDGIVTVLERRLERYIARYGKDPEHLPVTLDEWARLTDELWGRPMPVLTFHGVELMLCAAVIDRPTGTVIRR